MEMASAQSCLDVKDLYKDGSTRRSYRRGVLYGVLAYISPSLTAVGSNGDFCLFHFFRSRQIWKLPWALRNTIYTSRDHTVMCCPAPSLLSVLGIGITHDLQVPSHERPLPHRIRPCRTTSPLAQARWRPTSPSWYAWTLGQRARESCPSASSK